MAHKKFFFSLHLPNFFSLTTKKAYYYWEMLTKLVKSRKTRRRKIVGKWRRAKREAERVLSQ